jgi:hypothetical protein
MASLSPVPASYSAGKTAAIGLRFNIPFFFWGGLFIIFGLAVYLSGVLLAFLNVFFRFPVLRQLTTFMVWYSGMPVVLGLLLVAADLTFMLPQKRFLARRCSPRPDVQEGLTVVLTAYNDEQSIGTSVHDFLSNPLVRRVIVVSNNSSDRTMDVAEEAGAIAVNEILPGYGRCVFRCFQEALRFEDTDLVLLCEGDMTFRAADIPKFLAYIPHADIVNGTRIVEQLREYSTQLSTFMYYGNFFVGKLIEIKHLGKGTFTDAGTTYKLIRRESLLRLMPKLNPAVNLEFNCHFLDTALEQGEVLLECPITFHPRVGRSKGGNVNDIRALKVGAAMIRGLALGWPRGTNAAS